MAVERSDSGLAEAPRGSRAVYCNVQASHPFAVEAADGVVPPGHSVVPLHALDTQPVSPSPTGPFFTDNDDSRDLLDNDLVREISAVKPPAEGGASSTCAMSLLAI